MRILEKDEYMIEHMQCYDCHQDLVVARIVTVCEQGHINDFPWVKWVHRQSKKPICATPTLEFKTGASGAEGLEGLRISCCCGASASLRGAFDKDRFEKMDKESNTNDFLCGGNHPHKNEVENCTCYPRTVQRGSSSVYFPVVYSSLVIPPYADRLNVRIEKSKAFVDCMTIIEDEDEPHEKVNIIKKKLSKWVNRIATEIGADKTDVERILRRKWLDDEDSVFDVASVKYRAEEYAALNGEISTKYGFVGDFSRECISRDKYGLPHIKSVSLIDKVRVVSALIGFSRLQPVMGEKDKGFVHIKQPNTRWYPAYEVRGEGIFIEFEQNDIDRWIFDNPSVLERTKRINDNYAISFIGQNNPRIIMPKFIMLHTLSHLLIKQLSFECGYSVANLSERIYCAEDSDGKEMTGIFIYTASGDSEGTLGGLVRQGRPDAFPSIFKKAITKAKTCSNDPICILSHGQGRDSLNLAACYACALLPETCCEERNGFLDRGLVIGTFDDKNMGFFNELV
jgi:hypothetical protein